jgi:hypothetical protein
MITGTVIWVANTLYWLMMGFPGATGPISVAARGGNNQPYIQMVVNAQGGLSPVPVSATPRTAKR